MRDTPYGVLVVLEHRFRAGVRGVVIDTSRESPHHRNMLAYKVVETSTVTDQQLEEIINDWVKKGWAYDGVQFAMRESSKRPAMAFLLFTRPETEEGTG